jgi:hypothetical protein
LQLFPIVHSHGSSLFSLWGINSMCLYIV